MENSGNKNIWNSGNQKTSRWKSARKIAALAPARSAFEAMHCVEYPDHPLDSNCDLPPMS
jgi:hypothetical protein